MHDSSEYVAGKELKAGDLAYRHPVTKRVYPLNRHFVRRLCGVVLRDVGKGGTATLVVKGSFSTPNIAVEASNDR